MKRLPFLLAAYTTLAGAGTLFIGSYPAKIIVLDESTGRIVDQIPLTTGTPMGLRASEDRKRIYATTIDHNGLEVIDTATHKVINHFVLNTATTQYRFRNGAPDSEGKLYYTVIKEIERKPSHYEVSKNRYAVIDLRQQKIVKMVDIPAEDEAVPSILGMVLPGSMSDAHVFDVSPDGEHLYRYSDRDIAVLETENLKVVDRIDLTHPNLPNIEHGEFGWFGNDLRVESQPGERVTTFYWQDPVIQNRILGIGRFELGTRKMSFTPIGAAPEGMYGFQVTPDKKFAYAAVSTGMRGNERCEFWTFDLTNSRLANKAEFVCPTHQAFSLSSDGKKFYINTKFEIEVYDAATLKHETTWDLKTDSTGAIGAEIVSIP